LLDFGDKETLQIICLRALFPALIGSERFDQSWKGSRRTDGPGVPVLVSHGAAPIALALKSGNFGAPDFFAKALARLSGA
jgi:hypothetical protein